MVSPRSSRSNQVFPVLPSLYSRAPAAIECINKMFMICLSFSFLISPKGFAG